MSAQAIEYLEEITMLINPKIPQPDADGGFNTPAEGAKFMASFGIPQIPLRGKAPWFANWQDKASADFAQIDAWYFEFKCNFGSVAKAIEGGYYVLEADSTNVRDTFKRETSSDFTAKLIIQSGVGRGHRWYKHNAESLALSNIEQTDAAGFSLRLNNEQCVSPGSIHPERRTQYVVINGVAPTVGSPVEIAWLRAKKQQAKKEEPKRDADGKIPLGLIHNFLLDEMGKLRGRGYSVDATETALLLYSEENCAVHDADHIQQMVRSTKSWGDVNPMKDVVLHGGVPVGSNDQSLPTTSEEAEKYVREIKSKEIAQQEAQQKYIQEHWRDNFRTIGQLRTGAIPMLIHNFLPGGVTFLGGLPGESKTWLALSICKALVSGKPFLNKWGVVNVTPVLYLVPESGDEAFRTRCEKMGLPDDEKLFLCRTISDGSMLLSDPNLIEAVRQMKPVVFIDTLIRFSEADSENEAMQNKQLVNDITTLRQNGAVAVVPLHHSTKALREGEMCLENVLRGTGDIAASADAVYGLRRDGSLWNKGNGPEEINVECVKSRDMNPTPLPFRVALTRRVNRPKAVAPGMNPNLITQFAPGLESVIDATGDLQVCADTSSQEKREEQGKFDAQVNELVSAKPDITIEELEMELNSTVRPIRAALKRLRWVKQRGTGHLWEKKAILITSQSDVNL